MAFSLEIERPWRMSMVMKVSGVRIPASACVARSAVDVDRLAAGCDRLLLSFGLARRTSAHTHTGT
jgi:hypothetical protein